MEELEKLIKNRDKFTKLKTERVSGVTASKERLNNVLCLLKEHVEYAPVEWEVHFPRCSIEEAVGSWELFQGKFDRYEVPTLKCLCAELLLKLNRNEYFEKLLHLEEWRDYFDHGVRFDRDSRTVASSFSVFCQRTEHYPQAIFRLSFNHFGVDSVYLEMNGQNIRENKAAIRVAKMFLREINIPKKEMTLRVSDNTCECNAWLPWAQRGVVLSGMRRALKHLQKLYSHCKVDFSIQGHPSLLGFEAPVQLQGVRVEYSETYRVWFSKCAFISPALFSQVLSQCQQGTCNYLVAWRVEEKYFKSFRLKEDEPGEIFGVLEVGKRLNQQEGFNFTFESFYSIDQQTLSEAIGMMVPEGDYL
jgi:hypothetical protein